MNVIFDSDPLIRTLPDAIAFLKRFHRRLPVAAGLDASGVPDGLPGPLAMVYRELGGWLDAGDGVATPLAAQNYLVRPRELVWTEGMIEFAGENQRNWSCRCLAGPDDPEVFSDATEYWSEPREGFHVVSPTLSHFLITFCLTEAVFACPDVQTATSASTVRMELLPLWLNGRHVYENPIDFYVSQSEELLVMKADGWYVGSAAHECPAVAATHDDAYTRAEVIELSHRLPERGPVCDRCRTHIPQFADLSAADEGRVRTLMRQGNSVMAMAELRAATRCSPTWAKLWVVHSGRPQPKGTRPCPYCGMPLRSAKARQCRHCKRD